MKFKKAQQIFNDHVFNDVSKVDEKVDEINLFRAKEEALIKQRVTKLEGQRMHSAEISNTHAVWIGKLESHPILKHQGEFNGDIIKRLVALENAWGSMQAQLTRNTIKMGDIIKRGRPKKATV